MLCYCCYSDKDVIYSNKMFICLSCKTVLPNIPVCDICQLKCNNTCLDIFNSVLRL